MSQAYQDAIHHLYSLHRFGIKLGLSNIRNLLGALGEPQSRVPVIHIGGTNGKGSVAAFISSVLKCRGYRVGMFTSPHLEEFRERIRINDRYIPPEAVVDYCWLLRRALQERAADFSPPGCVTFFEFVTAMAYSYFADQGVDFAIMEVGLGGRLDATNTVEPVLTVITDIDYDHTDRLGDTLKQIAWEKCGIVKKGIPLVSASQKPEAMEVVEEVSDERDSPLTAGGREYRWVRTGYDLDGQTFRYNQQGAELDGLRIRLLGEHQVRNAALAAACCLRLERMGYKMGEEALRRGLEDARWPGRLEVMSSDPYVILDGAHNPAAVKALAATMGELFPHTRPTLVFGAMEDKDLSGMLAALLPKVKRVVLTRPSMKRSAETALLRELALPYGVDAAAAETVPLALKLALEGASPEDIILITGSLFTVGEARVCLGNTACG